MSNKRVFHFNNHTSRAYARGQCDIAPDGTIVTFDYEPKKTRLQEEKYHAMIADISASCLFMDRKWDREQWKRLLIDAFVRVLREEAKGKGDPDPFEGMGELVPALDGKGWVQLGVQSRNFKKAIAAQFVDYLYSWGTWNKVVWSEAQGWDERMIRTEAENVEG
jgi:hypothetical protein